MKSKLRRLKFSIKPVSTTAFCYALLAAVTLALAFANTQFSNPASLAAAKPKRQQSCPSCAAKASQVIYAPLIDLPEAQGSEIVFNSRSPQEMEVTPTFYKLDGRGIAAKPVRIKPIEIRYEDLKKLIPGQYRNDRDWGGMTLTYTGGKLEMWAQLRLLGINGGSNVDEFFSIAQEARADQYDAVWWAPPQSLAVIALGNITDAPTSATVRFGDGQSQTVNLAPHATQILRHTTNSRSTGDSVTIDVTGAAGSVIPTGFITIPNGAFNSVIRFYATKATRQPRLFANGLRLANATPHMILRNTSSAPITATPKFTPLAGSIAGNSIVLPAIDLRPRQTIEVDLSPLMEAVQRTGNLDLVSVEVANTGAPGSLIGALYNSQLRNGINYDVPLRDSGPLRNSAGNYPWRLDGDYTTVVSITNIGSQPATFLASINHKGGTYQPKLHTLAVGESFVFDLNKIRDEQIPDKDGKVLPRTSTVGRFHWSVLRGSDTVRLIGRGEMVSKSAKVSSSYSCPICCPDSFSGLSLSPVSSFLPTGGSTAVYVDGIWVDCYNTYYGPYIYSYSVSWWCENPSVVSMTPSGDHYDADGLAAGNSQIQASAIDYYYDNDGMDCYLRSATYNAPGNITVSAFTPHHLKILSDTIGTLSGCPATLRRTIVYQMVDVNSNPIPEQCAGCLNKKETFSNLSSNSCNTGNPMSSNCGPTSALDGRFSDYLSIDSCSGSSTPSCGFTMTQTIQWCPPTGSPVTLGVSQTTVRRNEIIVAGNSTNNSTRLTGKFLYPNGSVQDQ